MGKVSNTVHDQDHVSDERDRREKLAQQFISLSTLLPNPTKTDMASVLEDACNYIKELESHVKELEESSAGCNSKDVRESNDDEASSSHKTKRGEDIEVQMSGKSVLVQFQCKRDSSSYVNVLGEMLNIGLSIISTNAVSFTSTTLFINVVAEMADDFCMTPADLSKNLQQVL
ncbi:Myc-type, basic helix-loop-helix (bHLH) domain-containing protein [Artemisia annua]|uniref:Myc-type, basic helix-loop-helix (BHLH) domain-containing protein n=1 Tax=Artemisia annua TaxID=35608 RepID=A0A2U1QDQ3_ARTAN|nr:Myc-type, basic helix-loop-helix (bHLH) domain-containing protein [Artemisia annua]